MSALFRAVNMVCRLGGKRLCSSVTPPSMFFAPRTAAPRPPTSIFVDETNKGDPWQIEKVFGGMTEEEYFAMAFEDHMVQLQEEWESNRIPEELMQFAPPSISFDTAQSIKVYNSIIST